MTYFLPPAFRKLEITMQPMQTLQFTQFMSCNSFSFCHSVAFRLECFSKMQLQSRQNLTSISSYCTGTYFISSSLSRLLPGVSYVTRKCQQLKKNPALTTSGNRTCSRHVSCTAVFSVYQYDTYKSLLLSVSIWVQVSQIY